MPSVDVEDSFNDIELLADSTFGVTLPIGRPALTLEARYREYPERGEAESRP